MKIWIGRVLLGATIPALALAALHGVLFFSTKPKTLRERRVQLRPILGFDPQC
jgi:hypothetical protein